MTPPKAPIKADAAAAEAEAVLRHWLEDVPDDRLAHLVKDAMRGLTRSLQRRLNECSVSFGHWSFLRILWVTDGLSQRELSERAGVMEPTTFSALAAMEKLGYVYRVPSAEGGRKVHIFLTPSAKALKEKLVPKAVEVNEIAVRGVSEEDIAATRRTLLAVVRNLAEDEIAAVQDDRKILSTREVSRLIDRKENSHISRKKK